MKRIASVIFATVIALFMFATVGFATQTKKQYKRVELKNVKIDNLSYETSEPTAPSASSTASSGNQGVKAPAINPGLSKKAVSGIVNAKIEELKRQTAEAESEQNKAINAVSDAQLKQGERLKNVETTIGDGTNPGLKKDVEQAKQDNKRQDNEITDLKNRPMFDGWNRGLVWIAIIVVAILALFALLRPRGTSSSTTSRTTTTNNPGNSTFGLGGRGSGGNPGGGPGGGGSASSTVKVQQPTGTQPQTTAQATTSGQANPSATQPNQTGQPSTTTTTTTKNP